MHYADTSFIVSLIVMDGMTDTVRGTYRSLGRPRLAFGPLHQMEIPNALRLVCFLESRQMTTAKLRAAANERLRLSEARLLALQKNKTLIATTADWNSVMSQFSNLSGAHTAKMGTRSLDILQVAFALEMGCKHFVTCDQRQAVLAKTAGLTTILASL